MARNQRTYDNEYKAQAVKLAQEIGRCHDNARCESIWARLKEELLYFFY